MEDYTLKVDGQKSSFEGGAIRYKKDKGRYDLIPEVSILKILDYIDNMKPDGYFDECFKIDIYKNLFSGKYIETFIGLICYHYLDLASVNKNDIMNCLNKALAELSIHFQKGAEKYGVRNCEKGIPLWSFIDSGRRHIDQYFEGEVDEHHHINALWNITMAIWTIETHPELCYKDDTMRDMIDDAIEGIDVIKPFVNIIDMAKPKKIMLKLEDCARIAWQSFDKKGNGTDEKMIKMIIEKGHESVLEHESVTVDMICSRDITHEIVRHRVGMSYTQESTRYVKYKQLCVIKPIYMENGSEIYKVWLQQMGSAADSYRKLMDLGSTAQEARTILPNATKTHIRITTNMRGWRNFFKLRAAKGAHPQMKELAIPLLLYFKHELPVLFDDIEYDTEFVEKYNITTDAYVFNKVGMFDDFVPECDVELDEDCYVIPKK